MLFYNIVVKFWVKWILACIRSRQHFGFCQKIIVCWDKTWLMLEIYAMRLFTSNLSSRRLLVFTIGARFSCVWQIQLNTTSGSLLKHIQLHCVFWWFSLLQDTVNDKELQVNSLHSVATICLCIVSPVFEPDALHSPLCNNYLKTLWVYIVSPIVHWLKRCSITIIWRVSGFNIVSPIFECC